MGHDADVIVVGAGLAGLVAAAELADAGRQVLVVDQESEANLGGQAHWSLGGLFLVDSPEQRLMRVRDSADLAWQDWLGTAGFDREEDHWPRRWAEAYVRFAAGEMRSWLYAQGMRWFPLVGWVERGGDLATGPGNSVPRFHITWGTGPGVLEPFLRRVRAAEARGRLTFAFRHRVTGFTTTGGAVDGVTGDVLASTDADRGVASPQDATGGFELHAQAVLVTSGGVGGNHDLVRAAWPERHGRAPDRMLTGVPEHVDGRLLEITRAAGGNLINTDRMWHYPEGVRNHDPVWPGHALRVLAGPTSLWFDARGRRLPAPLFPGFDTLGALSHLVRGGDDHSWFVLNRRVLRKEIALSGSEQNPDITGKDVAQVLGRVLPGDRPIEAFARRCPDVVTATSVPALVKAMNELSGADLLDAGELERQIVARDREVVSGLGKDAQVTAIGYTRRYLGDKLQRVAAPHRILDPAAGPLVAIRLSVLTRKTLGGLETDLDGRVLRPGGEPVPGLYAAGEASGFGGGGLHGYRALEGTFLGGCLFSGRAAGRALAAAVS